MERWNRRVRRTCVGVILLALLLRLGGSGSMAATEAQSMAAVLLYLQTGRAATPGPQPGALGDARHGSGDGSGGAGAAGYRVHLPHRAPGGRRPDLFSR